MLELLPDPYAKPSRFANHRQRPAVYTRRGTATPGCATAVSGNIATSTESAESLSLCPPAAVCKLRRKRFEISTYESIRLKLHLESTLTEKYGMGTVGRNLASLSANRINRFRMIFLQKNRAQLFSNDILAKKGGWGYPPLK